MDVVYNKGKEEINVESLIILIIFVYIGYRLYKKREAKIVQKKIGRADILKNKSVLEMPVVGLNYENRKKILKDIVRGYQKEGYFSEEYEGLTDKEIKKYTNGKKVYELSGTIEGVSLEKEDDNEYDRNAIKVMLKVAGGEVHHIGYVPKEYCEKLRELMNKDRLNYKAVIVGGRYKRYNKENGIQRKSEPFGLRLYIM